MGVPTYVMYDTDDGRKLFDPIVHRLETFNQAHAEAWFQERRARGYLTEAVLQQERRARRAQAKAARARSEGTAPYDPAERANKPSGRGQKPRRWR